MWYVKGAVVAGAIALCGTAPFAQPTRSTSPDATLVLAGGCFWGVEAVFEHVNGVRSVVSGYARYETRSSRSDVPVEAVRIVYDPTIVARQQLLEIFFTVAHDPTSRDAQGPDRGPEYRAVVFHETDEDRSASETGILNAVETCSHMPGLSASLGAPLIITPCQPCSAISAPV